MEDRLHIIFEAASHLFINKGYSRTQMKDIAKEIGLSTGMLYVYFTGKRDILSFILKGTINSTFLMQEFKLPIHAEIFDNLENEVITVFEQHIQDFSAHLDDIANYTIDQMLSDVFDFISKYGVVCLLIENNPDDLRQLSQFYKESRQNFYEVVFAYVNLYIQNGTFRSVEHPAYCTRLIIETLSWWGMHMKHNSFELQKSVSIETAKSVCMDNLLYSYKI